MGTAAATGRSPARRARPPQRRRRSWRTLLVGGLGLFALALLAGCGTLPDPPRRASSASVPGEALTTASSSERSAPDANPNAADAAAAGDAADADTGAPADADTGTPASPSDSNDETPSPSGPPPAPLDEALVRAVAGCEAGGCLVHLRQPVTGPTGALEGHVAVVTLPSVSRFGLDVVWLATGPDGAVLGGSARPMTATELPVAAGTPAAEDCCSLLQDASGNVLMSFAEGAGRGRAMAIRLDEGTASEVTPAGTPRPQRLRDGDGDGLYELDGSLRAFVQGRGPADDVTSRLEWRWDGAAYQPVRCELATGTVVIRELAINDPACADPSLAPEARP